MSGYSFIHCIRSTFTQQWCSTVNQHQRSRRRRNSELQPAGRSWNVRLVTNRAEIEALMFLAASSRYDAVELSSYWNEILNLIARSEDRWWKKPELFYGSRRKWVCNFQRKPNKRLFGAHKKENALSHVLARYLISGVKFPPRLLLGSIEGSRKKH